MRRAGIPLLRAPGRGRPQPHGLRGRLLPRDHLLPGALRAAEAAAAERGVREGDDNAQLERAAPLHELLPLQAAAPLRPPRELLETLPGPRLARAVALPAPRLQPHDPHGLLPQGTRKHM